MKIWVDDERQPPGFDSSEWEEWVWVQTSAEAIAVLSAAEERPLVMSLDYVLGGGDTTDTVMYWLKGQPVEKWPVEILAHSSSAVACRLIEEMVAEFRPAPGHEPDCDDVEFIEAQFCQCNVPSGRDDPTSISNLMAEGPPKEEEE